VPARRELDSQLRGHNPRATVRWIACDSDPHGPLTLLSLLAASNCRC
jgi:hypothetical protein